MNGEDVREAVRRWLKRAESDWTALTILRDHPDAPQETICFHCQQYVEKLLKAFLTLHGIEAPKTHDLRRLIQLAAPKAAELSELLDPADLLTDHAVESRYPDDWREIESEETEEMISLAERFAAILLPLLTDDAIGPDPPR